MILQHLNNSFANPEISEEKYDKLADTHLQRLNANNQSGTYTALITEGTPKFATWRQSIGVEAIELAARQGRTISQNDSVKLIKSYISRKRGVIMDKFATGTPEYEQFYPHGALEYSEANLGNLRTITERWISAATTYSANLPANLGSDCQLFLDAFNTNRANALQSAGEVVEKNSDSDIARTDMNKWLYKSLLSLLLIHIDDVQRVKDFYDLSITKKKKTADNNYTVSGNMVLNVMKGLASDSTFTIENTGTVPLWFYTSDGENTPYQGWGIYIQAGQKMTTDINQLGGMRMYLNVHNQNPAEGSFKLQKASSSTPTPK